MYGIRSDSSNRGPKATGEGSSLKRGEGALQRKRKRERLFHGFLRQQHDHGSLPSLCWLEQPHGVLSRPLILKKQRENGFFPLD
jgi:hypothetical protein